jgi:hypothetical protein
MLLLPLQVRQRSKQTIAIILLPLATKADFHSWLNENVTRCTLVELKKSPYRLTM